MRSLVVVVGPSVATGVLNSDEIAPNVVAIDDDVARRVGNAGDTPVSVVGEAQLTPNMVSDGVECARIAVPSTRNGKIVLQARRAAGSIRQGEKFSGRAVGLDRIVIGRDIAPAD